MDTGASFDTDEIIEKLIKSMEEQHLQAEKGLTQLLKEVDPERLLVSMMALLLTSPVDDSMGDSNGTHSALIEILEYYALPMTLASAKSKPITPVETSNCQKFLEEILGAKTWIGMGESGKSLFRYPAEFIKMQSEIVRGNAYPEQTAGKIAQIQGKFDNWFQRKIGLAPSRAIDILLSIVKQSEEVINNTIAELREEANQQIINWNPETKELIVESNGQELSVEVKNFNDAKLYVFLFKYCQLIADRLPVKLSSLPLSPAITYAEENALKDLIGISGAKYGKIRKQSDIRKFPVCELEGGKVILSDLSNAMDFLWEAFDGVAKSDQHFYDRRYQHHKSKWVEDTAVRYLKRIFPDASVYQALDYPNLSKADGATTELDIAVLWEPFLVIIEVKAKQFRLESQSGDVAKLRSDLKANIEDAHKQALRAIEYIGNTEKAVFTERSTGRVLTITNGDIYKIFPVSLSLHQLGFISAQLDKTKEYGLFRDGDFPFSVCISDFDLLTRTCISPAVLLHYIEKRILLLNESEEYHGDELDLFAAYLDSRLHRTNLIQSDEKFNWIAFTGYSTKFDQLMLHDRGENVESPEIKLNVPSEIENLLKELKGRDNKGSRMISFALLDLDNALLRAIAKTISALKEQNIPSGIIRRGTFASDDIAVSILASSRSSIVDLYEKTRQRVLIEKYRRKLNKSMALGIVCQRSNQVLEIAQYAEFEWAEDTEMEQAIEEEAPFVPAPNVNLPGVNQPCICGSGKKFKKCCKRKIEDSRLKLSSR